MSLHLIFTFRQGELHTADADLFVTVNRRKEAALRVKTATLPVVNRESLKPRRGSLDPRSPQ